MLECCPHTCILSMAWSIFSNALTCYSRSWVRPSNACFWGECWHVHASTACLTGTRCGAGLTVMQILVPIFWFSDNMVNNQHDQARAHNACSFARLDGEGTFCDRCPVLLLSDSPTWSPCCLRPCWRQQHKRRGLQVFKTVFRSLYGDRPVRQLSEAERARLAEKVAERAAAKQARAQANPIKQVLPATTLPMHPC